MPTKPRAKKTTELFVMTPNSLGSLTRITNPLSKGGVNIESYCAYEWGKEAAYRLITDDNTKAKTVLTKEGLSVQEHETVLWETNNKPGMLKKATEVLNSNKVVIYCSYCTTMASGKKTVTAFTTSNPDLTVNVLNKLDK